MRSRDRRGTTAGVFFISSTVTSLAAAVVLGSLLDRSGFPCFARTPPAHA